MTPLAENHRLKTDTAMLGLRGLGSRVQGLGNRVRASSHYHDSEANATVPHKKELICDEGILDFLIMQPGYDKSENAVLYPTTLF